jgi:putative MATE family efflux protein
MSALSQPADLADPNLARLIARLAGPAILGISAHSLQMLANALFVAGLGPAAVAAVAIAQSATLVIAALGYGLGIGTASLVSRALGAGAQVAANRAAGAGLLMILPTGLLSSALLLADIDGLMRLLGADGAVAEAAREYTVLSIAGTAVMLVHIVGGFIARAEGNARFSMLVMVGSFGLNVALDALLILWLDFGLAGAGWATLAGQAAAAAAYAAYFLTRRRERRPVLAARAIEPKALAAIAAIGAPATAATLLTAVAMVFFFRAAADYGEGAVAALGIALRVFAVAMLPLLGLCTGAQAVLGYAWGAGDLDRLRRALLLVSGATVTYGLAWAAIAIPFARPLLSPLAPDPGTLSLAVRASDAFHAVLIPAGLWCVAMTLFQSIGAPRRAAIVSLAAQGYALVPLLLLLPSHYGFDGVIGARVFAELAACAIALVLMVPFWVHRWRGAMA